MYKNPSAELVTRENCPPRIVLDETSISIEEVMKKVARKLVPPKSSLAYIWRQPQERLKEIKASVIQGVFSPLAACLPFWELGKWSESCPQFILSDVFDLASGFRILEVRDMTCQYRVESFARPNGGRFAKSWVLKVNEKGICSRSLYEGDLSNSNGKGSKISFQQDFEYGPPPHVDGEIGKIHQGSGKKRSKGISIRALIVHQGEGTFFYAETPDQIGQHPFRERTLINPLLLEGRHPFQAQEGDVIFFQSGKRPLRDCFIHQAAMASPLDIDNFGLGDPRLVAVYDFNLV